MTGMVFDPEYVPKGRVPGEGMYGTLTASATGSTSLTGAVGGADASAWSNRWKNFRIRIVEDTVNPTAVGQTRYISASTSANPTVYTISSAWTVTPSSTAKYVIENCGQMLLMYVSNAVVYTVRLDESWNNTAVTFSTGAASGTGFQVPNRPAVYTVPSLPIQMFGQPLSATSKHHEVVSPNTNGAYVLDWTTLTWGSAETFNELPIGINPSSLAYSPWMLGGSGMIIDYSAPSGGTIVPIVVADMAERTVRPVVMTPYPNVTATWGYGNTVHGGAVYDPDNDEDIPFVLALIKATTYMVRAFIPDRLQ